MAKKKVVVFKYKCRLCNPNCNLSFKDIFGSTPDLPKKCPWEATSDWKQILPKKAEVSK